MKFEYPLQWLPQQPRTKNPKRANFGNHSLCAAGINLDRELKLLGAKNVILSSDLQTKQDGTLCARQYNEDTGVVIYFELKGEPKAMACDKWDRPGYNIWALKLSISAIRGLERWGGSEFLDGLFRGFKALPSPGNTMIAEKDYFREIETYEDLKKRYRELCKELHPDVCGSSDEFNIMSRQYKQRENNYGE